MSTAEAITLAGIVIVFLTTVTGWIFTYRAQKKIQASQLSAQNELARLQDQLTFSREQAQLLVDDRLDALRDMAGWVQLGREIYLDALAVPVANDELARGQHAIDLYKRIGPRLLEFRAKAPKYYYLARLWDPMASEAERWEWGEFRPPDDLPQLISFYEDEVSDQVSEALFGQKARHRPYVEDQFHGLHEAAVLAVERLKVDAAIQRTG